MNVRPHILVRTLLPHTCVQKMKRLDLSHIKLLNNVLHTYQKLYLDADWAIYHKELLNPLQAVIVLGSENVTLLTS